MTDKASFLWYYRSVRLDSAKAEYFFSYLNIPLSLIIRTEVGDSNLVHIVLFPRF